MSEAKEPADFGADDASEDTIIMSRDTIVGDLRDMVLDQLRHNHDALPWNARTEAKQTETVELVTRAVQHAVDKAVRLIASDGRPFLMGTLAKVQIKDGIQAQLNLSKSDPLRHALVDAQGQTVMVIVADSDAFSGTRGDVKVSPDQASLVDEGTSTEPTDETANADDDYQAAIELITSEGKCSTSFLQRQFSWGFNRATRVLEKLEANGVVSAPDANGKRTILKLPGAEDEGNE